MQLAGWIIRRNSAIYNQLESFFVGVWFDNMSFGVTVLWPRCPLDIATHMFTFSTPSVN